jgi:MOSC domain-containing protein
VAGRVVRISLAPVKALGLVHPEAVDLTASGVAGDRRFWLVDADGRLVNGKVHPRLMQVRPAWDEETRRLALRFPSGAVVEGVVEPADRVDAVLYGVPHPSRRVPGPWQDALREFAGAPLTLLWAERGAVDRGSGRGWMSLVSRASLERLREEAGERRAVDGRRFRMLFEIDGVEAHEEDGWIGGRVQVGEAVVRPLGDVGRCVVTKCDPDSGVSDLDTLGALARYRREGRTEPLPLGIYGDVAVPGRVCVGDAVRPPAAELAGQPPGVIRPVS